MAPPWRLQIHETAIEAYLYPPSGEVYELVWDVTRDTRRIAKQIVPRRSGTLDRGIMSERPKPSGPLRTTGVVVSTARHSLWVIEGTVGPITPRTHKFLKLPATASTPRSGPFIFKRQVRGQRPNNFLQHALTAAMAANRLG